MHVDTATRQHALLRILQRRFSHAEGPISLPELREEWKTTGLRESDLADGIRDLEANGCWTVSQSDSGTEFRLLPQALDRLRPPAETVERLAEQVVARAQLFRAARRSRAAVPGHGRRDSDPPEA